MVVQRPSADDYNSEPRTVYTRIKRIFFRTNGEHDFHAVIIIFIIIISIVFYKTTDQIVKNKVFLTSS